MGRKRFQIFLFYSARWAFTCFKRARSPFAPSVTAGPAVAVPQAVPEIIAVAMAGSAAMAIIVAAGAPAIAIEERPAAETKFCNS